VKNEDKTIGKKVDNKQSSLKNKVKFRVCPQFVYRSEKKWTLIKTRRILNNHS